MPTKEEIFNKKHHSFWDDNGNFNECLLRGDSFDAMDEYAKQQAIAFDKWKHENRWFSFENGYWHYTFEQGTSISDKTYNKHYRKTPDELYSQFIEQQTKE